MRELALAVVVAVLAAPPFAPAQEPTRERFTAFAVDFGSLGRGPTSGTVDVIIERWSTQAERRALVSAFTEKGPEGLRKALEDIEPLGRITTPGSIGYDLRYAHQVPLPGGGRRILAGTERPMSFTEISRGTISSDYPFTIVEMRLNAKGEGDGRLSLATKIVGEGDYVELENYDRAPIRLTKIKASKD
jgi:hypothetical protein